MPMEPPRTTHQTKKVGIKNGKPIFYENEKLKDRLSNAVKVFKQQKADIERLTAERDEAKAALEKSESRAKELEAQKAENSQNDTKFFELVEENENLKSKKAAIEKERKEFGELKEQEIQQLQSEKADLEQNLNSKVEAVKEYLSAEKELLKALNSSVK